eukprot:TRINITY_DN14169_c0_g1_i1.p1 TRINITY_DN14169_c0_g1~~TRINITY_DN14169_c0_g1_i1.p1  ORF type:complete len:514 (+),score=105.23 TRINITY_DN14169_c0_g1_i1:124-1665(+)
MPMDAARIRSDSKEDDASSASRCEMSHSQAGRSKGSDENVCNTSLHNVTQGADFLCQWTCSAGVAAVSAPSESTYLCIEDPFDIILSSGANYHECIQSCQTNCTDSSSCADHCKRLLSAAIDAGYGTCDGRDISLPVEKTAMQAGEIVGIIVVVLAQCCCCCVCCCVVNSRSRGEQGAAAQYAGTVQHPRWGPGFDWSQHAGRGPGFNVELPLAVGSPLHNSNWERSMFSMPPMRKPGTADLLLPFWSEHKDSVTGNSYYYNSVTKETTWVRPSAAVPATLPPEWAEHNDPTTGKAFYHNTATKETSWDMPAFQPKAPETAVPSNLPTDWVAHVDPATGKTFYQNATTQETTWDKPKTPAPPKPPAVPPPVPAAIPSFPKPPVAGPVPLEAPSAKPVQPAASQSAAMATSAQPAADPDPPQPGEFVPELPGPPVPPVPAASAPPCDALATDIATTKEANVEVQEPEPAPETAEALPLAAPESLPSDWTEHTDPSTGELYYYNAVTGETSWSKP